MLDIIPNILQYVYDLDTYASIMKTSKLFNSIMNGYYPIKPYKCVFYECNKKIINIHGNDAVNVTKYIVSFVPHYYIDYRNIYKNRDKPFLSHNVFIIIHMNTKILRKNLMYLKLFTGGDTFYYKGQQYLYQCKIILVSETLLQGNASYAHRVQSIHAHKDIRIDKTLYETFPF